jgi:peptidoglycan/LPS O-acetylase OafA/YrhL
VSVPAAHTSPALVASPPRPARLHLAHIDGLRAVAALVVYWNHSYAQVALSDTVALAWPYSLARISMVAGHLSVTVFIVLSGFCLTLPVVDQGGVLRGGVKEFLKRRARRILPPYYAAVALCLLLIATIIGKPTGSLWDFPLGVTRTAIVAHVLLLQDLFATARINYVFWSIAVEWHIYFLVPLLVWAWRRWGAARVVIGALALGYALRIGFADTRLTRMHPQFLGMFCFGMLAANLARSQDPRFIKLREAAFWPWLALAAFVSAVLAASYWGVRGSEHHFYVLDLPVGVMATALLVVSSRPAPGALTRLLAFRPLVVIGTFSYSLYLIHAPLIQILWQYVLLPLGLSREGQFVALMLGGLPLVLGVSYLFYLAFEAPFLRSAAKARAERPAVVAP